MMKSRVD